MTANHIAPWAKAEKYQELRDAVHAIYRSSDPRDRAIALRDNAAAIKARDAVLVERSVTAASVHASSFMGNLSVQYANEEFIADRVCPLISVDKLDNRFASYAKRDRLATPSTSMAGRMKPNQIGENRSYDSYSCLPYGLSNFIENKIVQNQDAPFNELLDLQESVSELMALDREIRVAALFSSTSNFGANTSLSGANRWDHASGGKPIADVLTATKTIWRGRGAGMTVGVTSLDVFNALRVNPVMQEAVKPGSGGKGGAVSREDIMRIFELDELYVGKARKDTANEGQAASYDRVWPNMFAVIRTAKSPGLRNAIWAATMLFQGKINSFMEFRKDVGTQGGWFAQQTCDEVQKVIASDTGYLIQTPIS